MWVFRIIEGNDEAFEAAMVEIINKLPDMRNKPISAESIDVSHPVKSERRDQKNVAIVKLVHRTDKYRIINAKKKAGDYKFNGQSIYINDHLSPFNRGIFASASEAKRTLNFKYLWVKNGQIYMRKDERSPLIRISKEDDIKALNPVNMQGNENVDIMVEEIENEGLIVNNGPDD